MIRLEQKACHFCESRNPFSAEFTNPEAVDCCFRRNDGKNLIIEYQKLRNGSPLVSVYFTLKVNV
ncbi:Uncharacterized protein dnm_086590 [Desulfonema magnum]|uniref:Uncharacterized protein n=1 Tax=Desulfonema magnum TaxID=45655 RepID=A0A975GT01_9BACT|nr:Uncharacterized protein dnm_086590 [Desulfonema magnum]